VTRSATTSATRARALEPLRLSRTAPSHARQETVRTVKRNRRQNATLERRQDHHLEVVVLLVRARRGGRSVELRLVLLHERRVDLDLGRCERGRGDKVEVGVADELAREPQERREGGPSELGEVTGFAGPAYTYELPDSFNARDTVGECKPAAVGRGFPRPSQVDVHPLRALSRSRGDSRAISRLVSIGREVT